jgi:hypothetical protein
MRQLKKMLLTEQEKSKDSSHAADQVDRIKAQMNEICDYIHKNRQYGQGEIRVGQSLEFSEDIFALCYCSQASDYLMDEYFDIITGRHLGHYESEAEREARE